MLPTAMLVIVVVFGFVIVTGCEGPAGPAGAAGTNGKDGANGKDGISIIWKGSLEKSPANPVTNWAYYNTADKKAYIYNGTAWQVLAVDGEKGAKGDTGNTGAAGVGNAKVTVTRERNGALQGTLLFPGHFQNTIV
jgi:hypothetical protein